MRWDMANRSPSRTNYFFLQRVAALVASLTKGPESLQLQWCHSCSILSGTIHSEGSETINLCTAGQDSHSLRLQGGFKLERCRAPEWLGEKFKLTFVGEWRGFHLDGPNSARTSECKIHLGPVVEDLGIGVMNRCRRVVNQNRSLENWKTFPPNQTMIVPDSRAFHMWKIGTGSMNLEQS